MTGVLSGKTITQITGAQWFSTALDSDGKVYAWGYNGNGALGNGNNTNSNIPIAVDMTGVLSGKTITQITSRAQCTLALDSDGKLYAWGRNLYGALGNGTNVNSNIPVAVDMTGVMAVDPIFSVTLGGLACTNVTLVDPTTITCLTPAHAPGIVDVTVSNGRTTSVMTRAYTYVGIGVPDTGRR
jgi:hypothetical protein